MYLEKKQLRLMLSLLITSTLVLPVVADRGRPQIDSSKGYNILLSDQNTLLRGVSLSWDGGDPYGSQELIMPTQQSLDALSDVYGFNTLHLYLEGDSSGNMDPVGTNAEKCDILVDRCAKAGLYLIINIGCNGENGSVHDLQFCIDFWKFYGPRYKDRTHVIYEAKNEPVAYTCGHWGDADLDKQVALYKTMRAAAPDTLLLMFSYQGLNNADAAAYAIKYLKNRGVNWSNAGIAWHGYTSPDAIIEVLNSFEKSTKFPASLCTEFFPGDTLDQEYNNIFESHFVGWTQFKWLGADDDELINLGRDLDQAGTVWIPDNPTATWPARGTPAIPKDGSRIGIYTRGEEKYLSVDSMKGYRVKADRESFTGKRTEWFVVETITPGVVSLKAANGRYLSVSHESKPINADARTVSDTEKFIWMELPNGDVALRACGTGLFLSTAGEGAPAGQVRADARSGTSPRSNVAVLDGSAADS